MEQDFAQLAAQYTAAGLPLHLSLQAPWLGDGLTPGEICRFTPHLTSPSEADRHTCSICISAILASEWARTLDCGHTFHLQCLDPWLTRQDMCPNCKRSMRSSALEQPLLPPAES